MAMPAGARPETIVLYSQPQGHGSSRRTTEVWAVRYMPVLGRQLLSNTTLRTGVLKHVRWAPGGPDALVAPSPRAVPTRVRLGEAGRTGPTAMPTARMRTCEPTIRFHMCMACQRSKMMLGCGAWG